MVMFVSDILNQYPFVTPLIVMVLSEIAKHLNEGFRRNVWFQNGGMPSSHSAFVTSLMIVVGQAEGMDSIPFTLATALACLVWYDAAFVRSLMNDHAKVLNIMQQFHRFSERVGHSVLEVVAGIGFGIGATLIINQLA